jgi:hypothetical protein
MLAKNGNILNWFLFRIQEYSERISLGQFLQSSREISWIVAKSEINRAY